MYDTQMKSFFLHFKVRLIVELGDRNRIRNRGCECGCEFLDVRGDYCVMC